MQALIVLKAPVLRARLGGGLPWTGGLSRLHHGGGQQDTHCLFARVRALGTLAHANGNEPGLGCTQGGHPSYSPGAQELLCWNSQLGRGDCHGHKAVGETCGGREKASAQLCSHTPVPPPRALASLLFNLSSRWRPHPGAKVGGGSGAKSGTRLPSKLTFKANLII